MYSKYIKHILDIVFAIFCLVLMLPVFIIIYLLILCCDRLSPLFIQNRVGKHLKSFPIYKFRTMNNQRDSKGKLLNESERVTKLGSFLRRTGLDELPQLVNILKLEMSFIGPRPLPVWYIDVNDPIQKQRHRVLPGITGLAQITGGNSLSWPEKFKLDNLYIEKLSFLIDIRIFIKTILSSKGYDALNFEHAISKPEKNDL
ncbi:sugar transferase [Zunongwangia sp.]|uniref:sugar transferase n=1 Tax=Zunongwangia sp. TaxID=1965325 RepID=UPI003AA9A0EE